MIDEKIFDVCEECAKEGMTQRQELHYIGNARGEIFEYLVGFYYRCSKGHTTVKMYETEAKASGLDF